MICILVDFGKVDSEGDLLHTRAEFLLCLVLDQSLSFFCCTSLFAGVHIQGNLRVPLVCLREGPTLLTAKQPTTRVSRSVELCFAVFCLFLHL